MENDEYALTFVSQRYQHLLQPVKDMAQTWQIDIAQDLESYRATVQAVLQDADPSAINFAEAAMVVTGGASIFAKKVDDLRNQVYDALLTLGKETTNAPASGSTRRGSRRAGPSNWQDDDTLPLIEIPIPTTTRQIDLKEGGNGYCGFVPRVPLFLLPREAEEGAVAEQSTRMGQCVFDEETRLFVYRELLGSQVLAKFVSQSSALHDRSGSEDEAADNGRVSLRGYSSVVSETPSPRYSLGDSPRMSLGNSPRRRSSAAGSILSAFGLARLSAESNDELRKSSVGRISVTVADETSSNLRRRREDASETRPSRKSAGGSFPFFYCQDVHAMLRRHGSTKPMKIPVPQIEDSLILLQATAVPSKLSLKQQMRGGSQSQSNIRWTRGPLPSLPELVNSEQRERRKLQNKARKELEANRRRKVDEFVHNESRRASLTADFVAAEPLAVQMANDQLDLDSDTEAIDNVQSRVVMEAPELAQNDKQTRVARLEEIIEQGRVQAEEGESQFIRQSSSDENTSPEITLYEKVNKWERSLKPLLDEQNKRPNFDVAQSTGRILHRLERLTQVKADENEPDVLSEGANPVAFRELVSGRPSWEVCRLFLSTLIMVNNGNVDLCEGETEGNFGIKLLDASKPLAYAVESNTISATLAEAPAALSFGTSQISPRAKRKSTPKQVRTQRGRKRPRNNSEEDSDSGSD